jgi:hypothetical protein
VSASFQSPAKGGHVNSFRALAEGAGCAHLDRRAPRVHARRSHPPNERALSPQRLTHERDRAERREFPTRVWIAQEECHQQVDQNDRSEQNWDEGTRNATGQNTKKQRDAAHHLADCDAVGLRRRKPKAAEKWRRPLRGED